MFNTFKIGGATASVSFNSPCTGIIQKSHPKSRFKKFHHTSSLAKEFFHTDGSFIEIKDKSQWQSDSCIKLPVTILQLMAFGDGEFICEFVFDSDLIDSDIKG